MTSLDTHLDINAVVEMGFSRERVEQAFQSTNNRGIPDALEWLFSHPVGDDNSGQKLGGNDVPEKSNTSTDPSIVQGSESSSMESSSAATEPSTTPASPGATALSLKCEDCGKLLRSEVEATMHASRSGHSNFSESTEEIKPLTEEEKAEQKKKLQQKLEERRLQRVQDEKEQEKLREKTRRKTGHDVSKARDEHALNEMKKLADERKQEKMEEKRLKQKLREQIAKDRADFKAKNQPQHTTTVTSAVPQPSTVSSTVSSTASQKTYNTCRIQFRLPDGSTHCNTFKADDTLLAVREYIAENCVDLLRQAPFTLSTTFPRKVYGQEDMSRTLTELRLVPSTVLILTKV